MAGEVRLVLLRFVGLGLVPFCWVEVWQVRLVALGSVTFCCVAFR